MPIYKKIIFSIITVAIFFGCVELVSRILFVPGSCNYIERRIIEQNLRLHKKRNEFRIFLYGESTMHGHYLYPYSTIDIWLKLYLKDLLPESESSRVNVTNFGRYGADSNFIVDAFIDTIRYKPDLAVFYAAHNDFCLFGNRREIVSGRSFGEAVEDIGKELPKKSAFLNAITRITILAKMRKSKAASAASNKLNAWYPEEAEAVIDDRDLLYIYSDQFNKIRESFEKNIERAIAAAARHSVPVVFLESVAKWKGYEPVRSIHGTGVEAEQLAEWQKIFSAAQSAMAGKHYDEALSLYKRCLDLDSSYALTYYRMGQCYEELNDRDNANKYYSLGNDYDRYPIRAPSTVDQFYERLRKNGSAKGVFFVPTRKIFESRSPNGIITDELIGDQIHPSVDGQAIIALAIAEVMYENGMVAPKSSWRWDRLRPVEVMKKDLRLDNDGEVEVYLALAGYVKRDYAKAAQFLNKALALKKDSIFIRSWLAWAYWKLGDKDRAIALYSELSRENPVLAEPFLKKYPAIREAGKIESREPGF